MATFQLPEAKCITQIHTNNWVYFIVTDFNVYNNVYRVVKWNGKGNCEDVINHDVIFESTRFDKVEQFINENLSDV